MSTTTVKLKYLIVSGWIHSKRGGDDKPFERGFTIPENVPIEKFREVFAKKYNKRSAIPTDFQVKEVTKKRWEKDFAVKA